MLHVQNQIELEKLCKGEIPKHIQDFFQEATHHYETLKGRQFRVAEMAILYTQALRLDPVEEMQRHAEKQAEKQAKKDAEAEGKEPGKKPAADSPFDIGQLVVVNDNGAKYNGRFAGIINGDAKHILVAYDNGEPPRKTALKHVRAAE